MRRPKTRLQFPQRGEFPPKGLEWCNLRYPSRVHRPLYLWGNSGLKKSGKRDVLRDILKDPSFCEINVPLFTFSSLYETALIQRYSKPTILVLSPIWLYMAVDSA